MFLFLIPLLLSFTCNIASAFTAVFSQRLGQGRGQQVSAVLRNALGMPFLGLAFVLAASQPAPRLFPDSIWVDTAGWLLLAAGVALIFWSLAAIRWRAAAPSMGDILVRHGPYAFVRHPLYDGVFSELAGAILVRPTSPILLSCLLTGVWVLIQARMEERDLLQRIPGYLAYMEQVPRFIPHLRKL
jgi:protein-S-isoprenylcysteine O-methyltransferase Ste14